MVMMMMMMMMMMLARDGDGGGMLIGDAGEIKGRVEIGE